jgi:hypothetical protein
MAMRAIVFGMLLACALAGEAKVRSPKDMDAWKQARLRDAGRDVALQVCLPRSSPNAAYQQWMFGPSKEIKLQATGACLDVADYSTDDEAEVYTYSPCHPEVRCAVWSALLLVVRWGGGLFWLTWSRSRASPRSRTTPTPPHCLSAPLAAVISDAFQCSRLQDTDPAHQNEAWSYNANHTITETMSGKCLDRSNYGTSPGTVAWLFHCTGAPNQQWFYNTTDMTIRATDSGLCLDGGAPQPRACDVAPLKGTPFCDTSLNHDDRAAYIVTQLKPDEKVIGARARLCVLC